MNNKNKLDITTKTITDIGIISLHGFLDAHTAGSFEKTIEQYLESRIFKIIVNLNELNYISSAGLGVFMAFIEEIHENNGDLRLCELSPKVFTIFDLLGFPLLFQIFDNEQKAISSFTDSDTSKN